MGRLVLMLSLLTMASCAALREEITPPANLCVIEAEECKGCKMVCDSHGPGESVEEVEIGEGARVND